MFNKKFCKSYESNQNKQVFFNLKKFQKIRDSKIKEGIFVGPHIREVMKDGNLNMLNEVEVTAWRALKNDVKYFLRINLTITNTIHVNGLLQTY